MKYIQTVRMAGPAFMAIAQLADKTFSDFPREFYSLKMNPEKEKITDMLDNEKWIFTKKGYAFIRTFTKKHFSANTPQGLMGVYHLISFCYDKTTCKKIVESNKRNGFYVKVAPYNAYLPPGVGRKTGIVGYEVYIKPRSPFSKEVMGPRMEQVEKIIVLD